MIALHFLESNARLDRFIEMLFSTVASLPVPLIIVVVAAALLVVLFKILS